MNSRPVPVAVLAAGLSQRMGRPKLTLPLAGKAVLRWTLEAVLNAVAMAEMDGFRLGPALVVAPPGRPDIRHALRGLPVRWVINRRPGEGLSSSLAQAAAAAQTLGSAGLLVTLGDLPLVPAALIRHVFEAFAVAPGQIHAPVCAGSRGHPVAFPVQLLPQLAALRGDEGARSLLRARQGEIRLHPWPSAPWQVDIDLPGDLALAAAHLEHVQHSAPDSTRC